MGWFDSASDIGLSPHHRTSSSRHRSHSTGGAWVRPKSPSRHHSTGSIFGSGSHHHNSSTRSFFSLGGRSHRRASPRSGYLKRMYSQLRRLLRDLMYYMKRHPMKVFVLVVMPLITGGALSGLLQKFGIRLPAGIERMFGGGGRSVGRGYDGDMQWERSRVSGQGVGGLMGGAGGLMSVAKMFM